MKERLQTYCATVYARSAVILVIKCGFSNIQKNTQKAYNLQFPPKFTASKPQALVSVHMF
jgi:hypothetical protein